MLIHCCPHCKEPLPKKLIKTIRKRSKKRISGMAAAKRKMKLTLENAKRLIAKKNAAKRGLVGGGVVWKKHSEIAAAKGKKGGCRCRECHLARGWTEAELGKWEKLEGEIRKRRAFEYAEAERKRMEKAKVRADARAAARWRRNTKEI